MDSRFEEFTIAISQIYRSIQKIKSAEMTELGLKGTHVMCLYFLGQYPQGLTAAELGRCCDMDRAAVSRAKQELEQKGLIYTDISQNQRSYRTKLSLSRDGIRTYSLITPRIERIMNQGGNGLEDSERAVMYRSLAIVAHNLSKLYLPDTEDKDQS